MSIQQYRMDLHQIPELAYHEFETKKYLYQHLKTLNGTIHEVKPTGMVVYFANQKEKSIAFRTDIDALPIEEQSGVPFTSKHPGKMHACGHDGHMAMLLGLADYVNEHIHELDYNVVLIFQPAEEFGSGAQTIVDSGLLEKYNVQGIFGFHVWPGLAKGEVFSKASGILAQCSEIDIIVHGKATHIANADQGIDAVQIATRLMTAIYDLEEGPLGQKEHLMKFGEIKGGTIRNIIAGSVTIRGSVRSFDPAIQAFMKAEIQHVVDDFAAQYNTTIEVNYTDGYPAVINNPELFAKAQKALPQLNVLDHPFLQGEDFGIYTQFYPSVFFLLGLGDVPPLHNEKFNFDMNVLAVGVDTYRHLLDIQL